MTNLSPPSLTVEPADTTPTTFWIHSHDAPDAHIAPPIRVWYSCRIDTPPEGEAEKREVYRRIARNLFYHGGHSLGLSGLASLWRQRQSRIHERLTDFPAPIYDVSPFSFLVKPLAAPQEQHQEVPAPSLAGKYTVDDSAVNFLQHHRFLLPLLLEAYEPIRTHFPDAQLFLKVSTDPESMEAPELVLSIAPTCPPEEAVDRFLELMETWWATVEDRAHDQLSIILKYR